MSENDIWHMCCIALIIIQEKKRDARWWVIGESRKEKERGAVWIKVPCKNDGTREMRRGYAYFFILRTMA